MGFWGDVGGLFQSAGTAIYNGVDYVAFDLLPGSNTSSLEGQIRDDVGYLWSGIANTIGQTPPTLLNPTLDAVPQWGQDIGTGLNWAVAGAGAGVGSAVGSIGGGAGSAVGSIGAGAGSAVESLGSGLVKPLLIGGLVVGGLILVLAFASKGRNVSAGNVRVSGGPA